MSVRRRLIRKIMLSDGMLTLASVSTGYSKKEIRRIRDKVLSSREEIGHLRLIVDAMAARGPLTFVQVGANDGKTGDPVYSMIHQYGGRALLIEPQSWLIDDLKKNYIDFHGDLVIENIAISTEPGTLPLYVLRQELWSAYIERVGRHPSAIFSPDRNQVLGRIMPRLGLDDRSAAEAIECIEVPSERLEAVMRRTGFLRADVVQIDCEGWDFEVIKSLGNLRPPVINFESFNLSDQVWNQFKDWCAQNHYGYIKGPMDTVAVRNFPEQI